MDVLTFILLIISLIVGFVLGWLLRKNRPSNDQFPGGDGGLERSNAQLSARLEDAEKRLSKAEVVFREKQEELIGKEKELSTLETEKRNLQEKLDGQREDLEKLQEKFTIEFENLATKILKTNTVEFAESNQKRLDQVLNPLKEKIVSFEKQVQEKYLDETKERSKLLEKIDELAKLNQTIGLEASNLTNALKGDNKAQGNWGELILEKILEASGLRRDSEYIIQHSTENVEGSRIQPDVVINLPDNKHIVVDSKVSLTAYQQYVNAKDEQEQEQHLKAHVLSLKNHIKQLGEKNYASGKGINSPDFVLLFVNIESGFSAAWKADQQLYSYAMERNIVIVSPSTLLATLRTIASVWKHEQQTQNAIEIARQSGALYDKFVGFLEDLQKVSKGIENSRNAYDAAMNKLKHGTGNLIGRVERIRKLGAKASKNIPNELLPETENEEDLLTE